jgi:hypothetical protein
METDGVWRHNTPLSEVVKVVSQDVKGQWDKTSIPNLFDVDPEKAQRKIFEVLKQGKILVKTPISRRDKNFASEMNTLLDMSVCIHVGEQNCVCPMFHEVNTHLCGLSNILAKCAKLTVSICI